MNRDVIIRIPKGSTVRQKIRKIYTDLHIQYRRAYPRSSAYPISRLKQNINNALSIHGKTFKETNFINSRYSKWENGVVIPYSHCYWLVSFSQNRKGEVIANVIDVEYEGFYHNDIMDTAPYDESKLHKAQTIVENSNNHISTHTIWKKKNIKIAESDLHWIVRESVNKVLRRWLQ